jgi:hypothetical protein
MSKNKPMRFIKAGTLTHVSLLKRILYTVSFRLVAILVQVPMYAVTLSAYSN